LCTQFSLNVLFDDPQDAEIALNALDRSTVQVIIVIIITSSHNW
jgi:hypothetical protein